MSWLRQHLRTGGLEPINLWPTDGEEGEREVEPSASQSTTSAQIVSSDSESSDEDWERRMDIFCSEENLHQPLEHDIFKDMFASRMLEVLTPLLLTCGDWQRGFTWKLHAAQLNRILSTAQRMTILKNLEEDQVRDHALILMKSKTNSITTFLREILRESIFPNGSSTEDRLRLTENSCKNLGCAWNSKSIISLVPLASEKLAMFGNVLNLLEDLFGSVMTQLSNGLMVTTGKKLSALMIFEAGRSMLFCSDCWMSILAKSLSREASEIGYRSRYGLQVTRNLSRGTRRVTPDLSGDAFIERLAYQRQATPRGTR